MSGGVLKLIINHGRADAPLLDYKRLKQILVHTTSLKKINKTHELYVHQKFLPFVSISWEYIKLRSENTPVFGKSSRFPIPQYGDFINDCIAFITLSVRSSRQSLPDRSTTKTIYSHSYLNSIPRNGYDWDNTTSCNCYYNITNIWGESVPKHYRNFVQLCEYPAERLFKHIQLFIGENPLEEYTSDAAIVFREQRIKHDKLIAYKQFDWSRKGI